MKYNFTSIIDRHGMDAIAIDALDDSSTFAPGLPKNGYDAIPMWVADMNFETVPTIPEAIINRAKHPLYGYYFPTDEYYNSIIKWHEIRNHISGIKKENIGYSNGVLGGVISALRVLCSAGDKVLVHSPTYIGFTNSLTNNGYNIIHSPLYIDEHGVWRMDFEDMERKIVQEKIHATIFCSPHNPCGRVWEKWEIEKAMALFQKYDVYVISDEIWSDIILGTNQHIPTYSVSEDARMRTVTMYAPSKTFNLAGLIGSYSLIFNSYLKDRIEKEASLCHYNDMNVLSMHALIGAYKPEGYEWTDELTQVLSENVNYACDYIAKHFSGVTTCKPQGTYMLFVDCKEWLSAHTMSLQELERKLWDVGVAVQDGAMFHGMTHLRMNLALPKSRVEEAFRRMDELVFNAR